MTGRLLDALREIDPDVTPAELSDAVWLLAEISRRIAPPSAPADVAAVASLRVGAPSPVRPEEPADASRPPPTESRAPQPGPASEMPSQSTSEATVPDAEPMAEWHLPTRGRVLDPPGWLPARSPGADALPDALAASRAMRPLHRRVASRTALALDEEATTRLAVEEDLLLPVLRAARDRWLDLVLVVDASTSMALWRRQIAGFQDLLEQLGAFRDVRCYHFDGDATAEHLVLRPGAFGLTGSAHDPGEVVDPTRRRAVLVVSDGVGSAWDSGAVTGALRLWAKAGPVAIVETLPQRLWPSCRPDLRPVRLRTTRRGAANAELDVLTPTASDGGEALPDGGLPVPVLELQPRWLRAWASLVADPGPEPMPFTVLPVGEAAAATRDRAPAIPEPVEVESPEERLAAFRAQASTDAQVLTQWLAAAPLSLAVMRLVQQATMPTAQPSVLAEVFLGGLLQREPQNTPPDDPEEVEYDFAPGVRDVLLKGTPRHDQLAVLGEVSRLIARRLGSPNDFPAFLAGSSPASDVLARDPAFARVALRVLAGLGGRYRDVALGLGAAAPGVVLDLASQADRVAAMPRDPHGGYPERSGAVAVVGSEPASGVLADRGETTPALFPGAGDAPRSRRVFGGVPLRNPHFTGRVELLERLHAMLFAGAAQTALLPHALHGLGGVGKTQLAIEYAWRYAQDFDLVWWLRAESLTTVRQGFEELAGVIGLPDAEMSKQVLNVLDVLQDRRAFPRWLMIFDNANAPEELEGYLPAFGNVLITSRNPEWGGVAQQLQVDVFLREESITLLQRRGAGIGAQEADKLAARLGDLPLALDQAAAWQAATGAPVAELERLLAERMAPLMSEPPPANYPASLMVTWDLAFGELSQRAPGAARLLELLAYFGSDPIAIGLLQESRGAGLPEPLGSVLSDEIKLRRAIREIGRYALAKPNAGRDDIEIHRLVQAVLRERLSPRERKATRDAVHRVIGEANPGYPDYTRTWARHAELLPHITPSEVIFGTSDAGHRAALDQIRYLFVKGDYERSAALAEAAVDAWRQELGPDHELTLLAQRHRAVAMRELGRYKDAAELNQETLARMREVFGDDHEHTLSTSLSIGKDLRLQGECVESRRQDEDTLERHRRVFGPDDPESLRAMGNNAIALRWLGDASGALDVNRECLEHRQQILGPGAPPTLLSSVNVARDLADLGRYAEARTRLTEVLPRIERLGASHRLTILGQSVLVMVLRRSGAAAQARELAEEVYDAARRAYTAENDYPLSATVTFANALLAVGETARARSLAEQAWQGYRHAFGPEHPSTLAAALDFAVVLRAVGDRQRALELDGQCLVALTGLSPTMGEDHPYLLVAMINLAHDHALASDFARARELSAQAYERSQLIRGDVHPETLICGLNHALDLKATGDQERAAELFDRMQITLRRDYGEQHPAVQAAARMERAETDIEHWDT